MLHARPQPWRPRVREARRWNCVAGLGSTGGGIEKNGSRQRARQCALRDDTSHVTLDAPRISPSARGLVNAGGESPALHLSGSLTDRAITLENAKFTGRALSLTATARCRRSGA